MTKPSPIAIIALCIVAVSVLAFTINDQLNDHKNSISGTSAVSKNATIISPIVTRNPPHGKPGHRHDLPDGAPLPIAGAARPAPTTNNLSLNNIASQTIEGNTGTLNPAHGKPGHVCGIAVGAPLSSAQINTTNAASVTDSTPSAGKNPAHGQTGHRCDIAVGAPLNSAPVKPAVANTAAITNTSASTQTATVAPGLNPAHGQPGHRCDIAVGASLNSPAKSKAATTPTAASGTNKTLNPSLFPNYSFTNSDSAKTTASQFQYDSTGAALNPAHGQPGHDCSISVGKPLKK